MVVESRVARMSYGVRYSTPFLHGKHKKKDQYWCDKEKWLKADNQMQWFLEQVSKLVNTTHFTTDLPPRVRISRRRGLFITTTTAWWRVLYFMHLIRSTVRQFFHLLNDGTVRTRFDLCAISHGTSESISMLFRNLPTTSVQNFPSSATGSRWIVKMGL